MTGGKWLGSILIAFRAKYCRQPWDRLRLMRWLFLTAVILVKVLLISPLERQTTLWHVARPSITECSKAHPTFAACALSKLLLIVNSWSTFNEEINYQRDDRELHSGSNVLHLCCKLTRHIQRISTVVLQFL